MSKFNPLWRYRSPLLTTNGTVRLCLLMLSPLQVLLDALQSSETYTDQDIVQAIKSNEFAVIRFVLAILDSGNNASIDLACECLAFAGNIYPTLWQEFLTTEITTRLVLSVSLKALDRCECLTHKSKEGMRTARNSIVSTQYLGYDSRDKKDFNMEGYDENDKCLEEATIAKEATEMTILTWLLLLFQFFCHQINEVNRLVRSERIQSIAKVDTSSSSSNSSSKSDSTDDSSDNVTSIYCGLVERILLLSQSLPEDAFLQVIKIAAAMNFQLPVRQDTNSTEVAAAFRAVNVMNMSQSLLHAVNENGFPHILYTETPAIIRMCIDLLFAPDLDSKGIGINDDDGEGGGKGGGDGDEDGEGEGDGGGGGKDHVSFFYTNDIKMLVELLLRELRNIPYESYLLQV